MKPLINPKNSLQYLEEMHASRAAEWPFSSLFWDPGELHKQPQGDSEPAGAGLQVWEQDQSEHRLMKPESGVCSDSKGGSLQARRGDARRWVTEGAAEISFTQVWLQFGIQAVSKLEDVHQSKRGCLSKSLIRIQLIFRDWIRLCFKLLYTDMETRSNSWLTAVKRGLNFGGTQMWIQTVVYFISFLHTVC